MGLAAGAAVTTIVALAESCNPGADYICEWHIAAALSVPLVAITTTAGAVIGATNAGGPIPIRTP